MIKLFMMIAFLFANQNESTILKLQAKFESIKYMQADFSQNSNGESSLLGKIYFSKKNNYRIELSNNIIISDGSSIWNEDIKRKKVIVSNIDEDPLAFSLSEYIYEYPSKCDITEERVDAGYLVILSGENTDLKFKTAKLWVNQNYLIYKIVVSDFGGNTFTLKFTNIVIDEFIDNSYFEYITNTTNKLIDLR
jgi:outer membrane lipoprotein-sorting protein